MAYEVFFAESALRELKGIKAFQRARIAEEIDEQLTHEPTVPTKKRKSLKDVSPGFEFEPPLWELRVGDYRVFYDVDDATEEVHVRAVREKPPEKRTGEVIQ